MLANYFRKAATLLLEFAIRIAPADCRDWGQAMRGELNYVENAGAAAKWALGSASVLAKQTLASILFPGRRGHGLATDGWLFAKPISLRMAALLTGGACVLAALIFFAAPPFRQAFQVAVKPWSLVFQKASGNFQPDFESLAERAEMRHDPEGLAFCAVRVQNPRESALLAEKAVRFNPNLIWVYAVVAMRHPALPEVSSWVNRLERWDSQNALFHLLSAETIASTQAPLSPDQERRWQSAMLSAFQSSKFDDYFDRVAQLNRRVVPRYHFYDPYEVESREQIGLPACAFENSERFAQSLVRSGADLELIGNGKGGREKYWTVARFGQLIDSQGSTRFEHSMGTALQAMAYRQLQSSSAREGNRAEATLFGYLAAKFEPGEDVVAGPSGESGFGPETARRNATVVEISGLMILVFAGLVVVAATILIAGRRRDERPPAQRMKAVAALVVLTSGVGLLFSAATLYLTYRPYWYIYQRAVQTGGASHARDLLDFLSATKVLPVVPPRFDLWLDSLLYYHSLNYLFLFWAGLTMIGVGGLALILLRHVQARARIFPLRHSP
jgi:hypothetical protein